MTDGGSGYSTTPTVTFSSPGVGVGSTALAYAVLNGDSVSEIRITSAGVGYTQIPTITISDPPLIASGEYVFNEIIVGTSSSTTARVKSWSPATKTLEVGIINGTFTAGETIRGETSGATYTIVNQNKFDMTESYNENYQIQIEADDIIDFTRRNPFGDP